MSSSLFVISGNFSGAGKTSILDAALKRFPDSKKVITCTTRAPRTHLHEADGVHYRFITKEDFAARSARGEFAEEKRDFGTGHWYGVLSEDIRLASLGEAPAFLVVELKGVRTLQEKHGDAHYVFIDAPLEELRARLLKRGDTPLDIAERMEIVKAERELLRTVRIDRVIVNRDGALDLAIEEFCAFVTRRMLLQKSRVAFEIEGGVQ